MNERTELVTCNWLDGWSPEEIADEQQKDPDLYHIIEWSENNKTPSEFELQLCSQATKHWWKCKTLLSFKNGILVYQWLDSVHSKLLILIPKSMREEVLKNCHNTKSSGHFGQTKTLNRLKTKFIWHSMRQDAFLHVKSCKICNINKKTNGKAKAPLGQYHAWAPMERVHMDMLGPLVESKRGNKYILVLIDQFTKWIECYAIPNQTAQTIATVMVDNFISRFGCPNMIHTDQGRNFDGNLFREVCELLEITKTRTTPFHPSSNGQIERYNAVIIQTIRCFLKGNQKDWDKNLQQLVGAIRSTENRNTGYTPNMLMLGREIQLPVDLMTGVSIVNKQLKEPSDYVKSLKNTLEDVHQIVRENIQSAQFRQKRDYDVKLFRKQYNAGDAVYRVDSTTRIGQSKKLRALWQGPYLVIQVISPVLYHIQTRKKQSVIHHDHLKSCDDKKLLNWLKNARLKILLGNNPLHNTDVDIISDNQDMSQDFSLSFADNEVAMKDRLAGDTGLHDQTLSSVLFSDLDTDGEDNIVNFDGGFGLYNIDSNNVTDTEFSGILDYPEHKTGGSGVFRNSEIDKRRKI